MSTENEKVKGAPLEKRKFSELHRGEGRERYLDMVQKERKLFVEKGVTRTVEQLLVSAGGFEQSDLDSKIRDRATGDQLRAAVPIQAWMPLSTHLDSLDDGVLKIAPLYELNPKQEEDLATTVRRAGFKVDRVESQLWDRAELLATLRKVHDLAADRCEKTLATWLKDMDNGLLLNQFTRDLLAEALQMRASDIHLHQDNAEDAPNWIKYRVDGDLIPMHLLPSDAMARLTTLLKRDAGLNFGDRSTPKDGRFGFMWQGRSIDVRVAAGPQGNDGEKLTMRLLDRASLRSFDELFRRHEEVQEHLAMLLSPEVKGDGGLILLSGPTGSGKTTTLYACVQQIDRRRRHVLTIEDPIEYEIRYATQWQTVPGKQGGSFADLIRASLRHDPDYIIVGEMRDGETVETALRAAESGHTVISTIHADSAVQTLERLRSFMPSEKDRSSTYTLSQQIRAVLNQRLVRTLCQSCSYKKKSSEILSDAEIQHLQLTPDTHIHQHNPNGCDLCNRTGYLGRTLLLEALLIEANEKTREKVYNTLITDINRLRDVEGVALHTRSDGLCQLVREGYVDPFMAMTQLQTM